MKNTYNHFLKAEQDVMDKVLDGGKGFEFDEALIHQAIDIIMLNYAEGEKTRHDSTNNPFTLQPTNNNDKYIIDNSGGLNQEFKNKTICCQSTLNDGIIYWSHACTHWKFHTDRNVQIPVEPVETDSDMHVTQW